MGSAAQATIRESRDQRVFGAGTGRMFWHILVPLLGPGRGVEGDDDRLAAGGADVRALVARAASRGREIALRAALGATRILAMPADAVAGYNPLSYVADGIRDPIISGLDRFQPHHPDRYFDVGIAEEHAVIFAAGLATKGFKPFVAIYSTFLQRAFDQVIHDVCLQNLPGGPVRPPLCDADTAEIAHRLFYSERTVKNIIHDVTSRLELRNRAHAVAYAMKIAPTLRADQHLLVNLSGRGDKDVAQMMEILGR